MRIFAGCKYFTILVLRRCENVRNKLIVNRGRAWRVVSGRKKNIQKWGYGVMVKPLNYTITYKSHGEQKELLFFTHQAMLEKYIDLIKSTGLEDVTALKAFKCYEKKPAEEYTEKLNKFICYGK